MKRGRRILLMLAGCAIIAVVAASVWPGEREPEYQGKKLSEWLFYVQPATRPWNARKPGPDAIRAIGTNGLPLLLKWANHERAARQNRFVILARRLGVNLAPGLEDEERARDAWFGLQVLGPQAAPAIPALFQMATNSATPDAASGACTELGWIGPEALPVLLVIATNQLAPARVDAIISIGALPNLQTNADLVVPVLVKVAQEKDKEIVWSAINSLGRIVAEPEKVVPTLAACLQRPEAVLRRSAAEALGSFRQAAAPAVPQLIDAMNDKEYIVRYAATNALRKIAPEVLQTNAVSGR